MKLRQKLGNQLSLKNIDKPLLAVTDLLFCILSFWICCSGFYCSGFAAPHLTIPDWVFRVLPFRICCSVFFCFAFRSYVFYCNPFNQKSFILLNLSGRSNINWNLLQPFVILGLVVLLGLMTSIL